MSDHSKILKRIETLTDPQGLMRLIERARDQGAPDVEEAAKNRLFSLVPGAKPGSVEHDFWGSIHALEFVLSEERGKTTRLSRTRQKVERDGVIETLKYLVQGEPKEGFKMLIDRNMHERTGEAVLLRHRDQFEEADIEAARDRLASVGYETA